jgi:tRNA threonylcarbamoyladenosine biosynthesis protein TsaE
VSHRFLQDAAATQAFAADLARALPAAHDAPVLIELRGELGAGKTTFAQGFLAALGVAGPVRSPTYALVESYEAAGRRLVHADLYRLASGGEFEELGLREQFVARSLWLVEWPERAAGVLPEADLVLDFGLEQAGRSCRITTPTAFGREWLQSVRGDGSGGRSSA